MKTHRLTLEFTETVKGKLNKCRQLDNIDNDVEVIRRALAVYECLLENRGVDNTFWIKSPEGEIVPFKWEMH